MPLIIMERYTLQQRIKMIKTHYKNGKNFAETVRKVKSFPEVLEATLMNRIGAFGARKTQKWLLKKLSIRNV